MPPIIAGIGQYCRLLERDRLHFLIAVGEAAVFQKEITSLFHQTLQFDRIASILPCFPQIRQGLLDRKAILPCSSSVRFGLDHPLREYGEDLCKLLFALRLPSENAAHLFGFASPLPVPVRLRAAGHLLHLFVGILIRARAKIVKPIPQGNDRCIDDLPRDIEQPQGVCLRFIRQTEGITQGLLITACAHCKSSFCL